MSEALEAVRKIAEELDARAEAVVTSIFRNARREGSHYRLGSLAGEAGQSLCITVKGAQQGRWKDFASAGRDSAGDMLDLVRLALYNGDRQAALQWARNWLGISATSPQPTRPRPPAPKKPEDPAAAEIHKRHIAQAMWIGAQPKILGTTADRYLRARGLEIERLGRQPGCLRYAPSCTYVDHEDGIWSQWPAMLACITAPDGGFAAVHRTYLATDGSGKAPVENPKLTLGTYRGGCIRLWRGKSRKPLRDAEMGEPVVVTEGIEDGLTVALEMPELRVLVTVSLSNMANVALPQAIGEVIIMAQNDPPGSPAEKALYLAIEGFQRQRKKVRIARFDRAYAKDANEAHQRWLEETREGAA